MKASDLLAHWIAVAVFAVAASTAIASAAPLPASAAHAPAKKLPVIISGLDDTGWVAQSPVSQSFVAGGEGVTFTAQGLPPGLVLNAQTGQVTGVLLQNGTFHLKVRAKSSAGTGPVFLQDVHVAPLLTLGLVGPFSTVLARDATLNDLLGGTLSFITTPSGAFSGKLRLANTKIGGAKIVTSSFTGTFGLDPESDGIAIASLPIVIFTDGKAQEAQLTLTVQNETDPENLTGVVGSFTYVIQREGLDDIKGAGSGKKPSLTAAQAGRWTMQVQRATQNNQMIVDPSSWVYPAGTVTLQVTRNASLTWGLRLKLSNGQTLVTSSSSILDPHLETSLFVLFPNSVPARSLIGHVALFDDALPARPMVGQLDYGNTIAVEGKTTSGKIWEYFLSLDEK